LEQEEETVRCLALPLVGNQLLVPNAVVAEVFAAEAISPAPDGPDWLLGTLAWRGEVLPVVCMEVALGGTRLETGTRSKIVVISALTASESLKYYAVLVQGIPHQVLASNSTVTPETPINAALPFVAVDLQVEGGRAFVPDLDAVERALLEVADLWHRVGSDDGGGDEIE